MIYYFFELLPVVLACIAAVSCSLRFARDRRKHDRLAMVFGSLSAVILVVAQSSWWVSYAILGNLEATWFANIAWTVFNSLSMTTLILISQPWRKS